MHPSSSTSARSPIWWIQIDHRQEGPLSALLLRHHPGVTPDTLARREESDRWRPIREIPELQWIFEDAPSEEDEDTRKKDDLENLPSKLDPELVLALQKPPSPFLIWLLCASLFMAYAIYQLLRR